MKVLVLFIIFFHTLQTNNGQNHTEPSSGSLVMAVQRLSERLVTIETLIGQQMRKLDLIDYKLTKLEVLSAEKNSNKEKTDNGVVPKKLEDLEWEIHKCVTLLEVMRSDLDRVHQKQAELSTLITGGSSSKQKIGDDDQITSLSDISSKIQTITSHLNALRRINEITQVHVQGYGSNLNNVINMSREIMSSSKQLVSKNYFQEVLKTSIEERPIIQMTPCEHSPSVSKDIAEDCSKWLEVGYNKSGVYQIKPTSSPEAFYVWCDMETAGGGWTVFQKRFDGQLDFYQEWPEYKHGFGNIAGEYWLGNDKLHWITKNTIQRLRIEMEDMDNDKVSAEYSVFAIGPPSSGYAIQVIGTHQGEIGDSFSYHAGMKFSTKDVDNDQWEGGSCAEDHTGAWWYKGCDMSNLNGQYLSGTTPENMQYKGMYWYEWHGPAYSVQKSTMMVRPS